MPLRDYLPEELGSVAITPSGPFEAGSYQELILTYKAGKFGIDDTGMLKIAWRTTSDMGKPQLDKSSEPNYTTVTASNGAELECRIDRVGIRPWANTLVIRVGRGYLREGDTITIRLGDRRQGSPGIRMQTNCEVAFEYKFFIDAFATYEFTELPTNPIFALLPGPAERWTAFWPSEIKAGEPFRLSLNAWDRWGNPTPDVSGNITISASRPIANLASDLDLAVQSVPLVCDGLIVDKAGPLALALKNADGEVICHANPTAVVESANLRRYWGDLHGQSGETVGTNPADLYFRYARDQAAIDIVGHQGNDFQITDAFWKELNHLTAKYEVPGRFLALPGYEWSGNTGLGGDRNVFYATEGRPIRRSSRILIGDSDPRNADCYTARDLFSAMQGEDAVVIAHVGGRFADIHYAHDAKIERAVEVHSTWGTFEWILHDAFAKGYRVGVVCHSDDHKGRPGATRPGASTFGAIGGLTCYFMPELTRPALFAALRRRHHYGTTGTRIKLDLAGHFDAPVDVFVEDPSIVENSGIAAKTPLRQRTVMMGDIVRAKGAPMSLRAAVSGTAPIERIDVFHGTDLVATSRKTDGLERSRRVRIMWHGALYRGRGREVLWKGRLSVSGNSIKRFEAVNFLNPERKIEILESGKVLAWQSVTTGNMAAIDLWLDDAATGRIEIETNVVSTTLDLASLGADAVRVDGGLYRARCGPNRRE
jgi:Protein of unknown function (DUF3604)